MTLHGSEPLFRVGTIDVAAISKQQGAGAKVEEDSFIRPQHFEDLQPVRQPPAVDFAATMTEADTELPCLPHGRFHFYAHNTQCTGGMAYG